VPADLSLGKLWSRRKSRHLTRYHRRRSRRGVGGGRTGSGCISENGRARQIDGIDLSINQGHLAELTVNDPTRDPVCVAGMLR
jgi:hypothetical protein